MMRRRSVSLDAVRPLKVPTMAEVECSSSVASIFTFSFFFALVIAITNQPLAASFQAASSIYVAPESVFGTETFWCGKLLLRLAGNIRDGGFELNARAHRGAE